MGQEKIPTGSIARGSVAVSTLAKAGGKSLKFLAKKPFLSAVDKARGKEASDNEIAEALFEGLSKLRGTALKIAQMLSLETNILPAQFREQLARSHYQVPPLNQALVRKVVESEFGRPIEDMFATFDLKAFAAASLGQVHKATLPDGTIVAVKVQYPGIGDAIATDIKMVRTFIMPLASRMLPKSYLEKIIGDIGLRLAEETDYRREAEQAVLISKQNKLSDIVIPKPFLQYSGRTVLTTEFLDGLHLDAWLLTNPSQAARNRVGQAMSDFQIVGLMESDRMHADPNPGNYMFLSDGRVGVIDFGCVKVFEDKNAHEAIKFAVRAMFSGDETVIFESYRRLGVNMNHPDIETSFRTFLLPFAIHFRKIRDCDVFDFKANPDYAEDIGRNIMMAVRSGHLLEGFTPDTVFVDRNNYGLFRILTALGSEVNFNHPLYDMEVRI